jgi:hypothetical protein
LVLKASVSPPGIMSGMAAANRILTNGETEEVEPRWLSTAMQDVGYPCFARLQVESHVVQPVRHQIPHDAGTGDLARGWLGGLVL